MNLLRLALLAAVAAGATACKGADDAAGPEPLAFVRYLHAMPDEGAVTVRLVDRVENINVFNQNYRYVGPYQGIVAGSRNIRVFRADADPNAPTAGNPALVSTVITDATVPLTAGQYYTILHTSGGGSGARFVILEDNPAAPATSQVAVRTVVAAPGVGPLDVYATASATAALPSAATFSNVSFGTPSAYVQRDTAALVLRGTASGTTAPVVAQGAAPAGAAGTSMLDPVAGSRIGGTAMTAFVFPASVTGSRAPQTTAFQSPTIIYAVDRRPPRP
jgi:hypothetical protein